MKFKIGKSKIVLKWGDKYDTIGGVLGGLFGVGISATILSIGRYYNKWLWFVLTIVFGEIFLYKFTPIIRKVGKIRK